MDDGVDNRHGDGAAGPRVGERWAVGAVGVPEIGLTGIGGGRERAGGPDADAAGDAGGQSGWRWRR